MNAPLSTLTDEQLDDRMAMIDAAALDAREAGIADKATLAAGQTAVDAVNARRGRL